MIDWQNCLFHSLASEWTGDGADEDYLITRLLDQLVKLQLIIAYGNIFSYNNIRKTVDFKLAQDLFDELFKKYCDIVDLEFRSRFRIQRNEEANFNGDDYISLIPKYLEGKQNWWCGYFCFGDEKSVPIDYTIYGKRACHPFRIVINLIVSNKILNDRQYRIIKGGETQVIDAVPFEYIKGIAIGTQQKNPDALDQAGIYLNNYRRRLNLVIFELTCILKKYGLTLPVYDIITEKPFEIVEENKIPIEIVKSKKFTGDPIEE